MDIRDVRGAGIRSVEKGLGVLRALQAASAPLRLNDIAAACGMSASMAHGYLVSLVRTGFVTQERVSGLYDLGDAALQLGLTALGRADFLKFARDAMAELGEKLGETVTLAVWSERGPVVVDKLEGRRDSVYEIRVGSVVTLWPTATGRIFLANLPEPLWRAQMETILGAAGEVDRTRFDQALEQARAAGVATTLPATVPDFSAIAAPIFDHRSALKGVMTVIGRASGFEVAPDGRNALAVKAAAYALSLRLGMPRG